MRCLRDDGEIDCAYEKGPPPGLESNAGSAREFGSGRQVRPCNLLCMPRRYWRVRRSDEGRQGLDEDIWKCVPRSVSRKATKFMFRLGMASMHAAQS